MLLADVETVHVVSQTGYGLGSMIAVVCSWQRNRSIVWAIIAGILSWFYVIYFDSKQIVNVTDKTLIPTTPHHFVAQTDMGSWADVPTSKEPTRIELALDYVKQWSYRGS